VSRVPSLPRRGFLAALLPSRAVPLAGAALLIGALAAVAGCGTPPELRGGSGGQAPRPSTSVAPTPTGTPALPPPKALPTPTGQATTPTFDEAFAVDCAGHPTSAQVVRVLRREGFVGAGARVTVRTGPVCAGTWQYTVVTVPGREPLAVVTRGRPGDLTLVTAGTDVCSIPVRVEAPLGIRTAAACA
jgi:hypothetical protein